MSDLGVAEASGELEIDRAHRRLAKEHHPDRGGSPVRMSEINAARDQGLAMRKAEREGRP